MNEVCDLVVEGPGERITVTVMHGLITASFSHGCVTHSSAPLISVLFWLTCGIAVQSRVIHGLSTVILRCLTYTHTQTQTLMERFSHAASLCTCQQYNRPQLVAYAPTGNAIVRVCRTYIISIPKCN